MNLLLVNLFQISDVINLDEEFRKEVTTVLSNCGLPMILTVRIVSLSFNLFLQKINVQMENQNP